MSLRPHLLALLVAVPLLVAVTVLSLAVVRADRAEAHAAQMRLALWRLDAQAGALLVAEASAAPDAYQSFHAIEAAGGRRVQVPSPLLALPQEPVLLHIQIDAAGRLSSPQVPDAALRRAALAGHTTAEDLAIAERRLAQLAAVSSRQPDRLVALVAALPDLPSRITAVLPMADVDEVARKQERIPPPAPAQAPVQDAAVAFAAAEVPPPVTMQQALDNNSLQALGAGQALTQNANDFQQRADVFNSAQTFSNRTGAPRRTMNEGPLVAKAEEERRDAAIGGAHMRGMMKEGVPTEREEAKAAPADKSRMAAPATTAPTTMAVPMAAAAPAIAAPPAPVRGPRSAKPVVSAGAGPAGGAVFAEPAEAGPMQAHWLDGHLLMMRRARVDSRLVAQAAVVDWSHFQRRLTTAITDLLPDATLVATADTDAPELRLAALPVRLEPGSATPSALRPAARWTLVAAWLGTLIGIAGAATLLTLAHRLGERRAAFVSAVTHELRTPLTSMRLHADLLADRRIADDPDKRAGRIAVLRAEAGRLAHLIDNVLDYARLERRRPPEPRAVSLEELLQPILPRLAERLTAAGLTLDCAALPAAMVCCDPAAVQRIFVNLVDNAAKYAAEATERTVILRALIADRRIELHLRDHGPGIATDMRPRLFLPFARSAEAAAGNAPGVGLGLALCRRMARAQGGDLRLDQPGDGSGTDAVLVLPLAG